MSIRSANWLYFITIGLILTVGSIAQAWNLAYGLIFTEIFLILIPTLIWLRVGRLPVGETLRLRGPRLSIGLIVLLVAIGASAWALDAVLEGLATMITGLPAVDIPADSLPKTGLEKAAYFIALAVFAPVCEEILFRGAVQGAYERQRPARFAILITALMFAFYHMRPVGLVALLPVALILGYVVYKTQSLWAGMLVHFGNNAASGLLTLTMLGRPDVQESLSSPAVMATLGLGILAALLAAALVLTFGLGWLRRRKAMRANPVEPRVEGPDQPTAEEPAPAESAARMPLVAVLPLVLVGLIFVAVTVYTFLGPGLTGTLHYISPNLAEPQALRYRILNPAGDPAGELDCRLDQPGPLTLDCQERIDGYDITVGQSRWVMGDLTSRLQASWNADDLGLEAYRYTRTFAGAGSWSAELNPPGSHLTPDTLVASTGERSDAVSIEPQNLVEREWPFRGMYLNRESARLWTVRFVWVDRYIEREQRSGPLLESVALRLASRERIHTPAGDYETVRLSLGSEQSAWYDTETGWLVKFSDRMHTYELVEEMP